MNLTPVRDQVFFTAETPLRGRELWRTDGTAAGTRLVRDLTPGPASSNLGELFAGPNVVYFRREDGGRYEVWRSDGTFDGTTLLWSANTDVRLIAVTRNGLVFSDFASRSWVAREDDLQARPLARLRFPASPAVVLDGVAYYASYGSAVWRTDGTEEGTRVHFAYGKEGDYPGEVFADRTSPYLHAAPSNELWRLPAEGSPVLLAKLGLGHLWRSSEEIAADGVYLVVDEGFDDYVLWRTDGTSAGTRSLFPIDWFWSNEWHPRLIVVDGALFITPLAETGSSFGRLLITDGTRAGTREARPGMWINASSASLGPLLLFGAFDRYRSAAPDVELWRSDGTTGGTLLVRDIAVGDIASGAPRASNPTELVQWRDMVLFTADDHVVGRELWRTDGTGPGTRLVANIAVESAIEGRVIDGDTGMPLAGVTVEAHAPTLGGIRVLRTATTDAAGHYRLELRAGTYKLRTRNGAGYIDQMYGQIFCVVCEIESGTPFVLPAETTLTVDFGLLRHRPSKRRPSGD